MRRFSEYGNVASRIVLTEMGPVDLQLIRVICKIWSNFLNVVLFFCKAIFAAFLFGNAKLQNDTKWLLHICLPSAVWARTM